MDHHWPSRRRTRPLPGTGVRVPPTGKYFVRPTAVDAQGFGAQVVAAVAVTGRIPGWGRFSKTLRGTVYLVGTRTYDATMGIISFPDLDFTIETRQALVKLVDFLDHDSWRDQLRGQLRLGVRDLLDRRVVTFSGR